MKRAAGRFTRALRLPVAGTGRAGELLARLASAAPEPAGAQDLPREAGARLARITREIDETVMPRLLHLQSGAQEIGRIGAARRRVLFVALSGAQGAEADAEAGAPQAAAILAARLAEIAAAPAPLTLSVRRGAEAAPDGDGAGCALADLRAALAERAGRTGFDRLRDQVLSRDAARLLWHAGAEGFDFAGAPEWQAALIHLALGFRAAAASEPGPEGMAIPVSGQEVVILARRGGQGLAAVLPLAFGLETVGNWLQGEAAAPLPPAPPLSP